jgi:hypothetical protein
MSETIEVNCDCYLSKDSQLSSRNSTGSCEVLVNIKAKDDKEAFKQVFIEYDADQQCCEVFGERIFKNGEEVTENLSFPFEMFIKEIIWDVDSPHRTDCDDEYRCGCDGGEVRTKVVGKDDVYYFSFYNEHNGYYCHSILLKEGRLPDVKILETLTV